MFGEAASIQMYIIYILGNKLVEITEMSWECIHSQTGLGLRKQLLKL